MTDTTHQQADSHVDPVAELLGLLAYAELTGSFRLAVDADGAPDLRTTWRLAELAVERFAQASRIKDEIAARGIDADAAIAPFVTPVDAFHARTVPADWREGLLKAFVTDEIAADFYNEIAERLDPAIRDVVAPEETRHPQAGLVGDVLREVVAREPAEAGRLSLYARRVLGETFAQAQRVAAEHEGLLDLLAADGLGAGDLIELASIIGRLGERHRERVRSLGLTG